MSPSAIFADDDLTADAFLGGRLSILQPRRGYRAGLDPVLLAAAVTAAPGARVLDLGTGAGTVLLCLAARVPGLDLTGVEIQPDYADLARRNADRNGVPARILCADATALPPALRAERFDHVTLNPPWFARDGGTAATDTGRDAARREAAALPVWLASASRRLAPRGRLWLVLRAERLAEALAALPPGLGGTMVLPVAPRSGRPAGLVIVSATKGSRAAFRLLAPVVLHEGDRHERDAESFSTAAQAVLRDAAALPGFSP